MARPVRRAPDKVSPTISRGFEHMRAPKQAETRRAFIWRVGVLEFATPLTVVSTIVLYGLRFGFGVHKFSPLGFLIYLVSNGVFMLPAGYAFGAILWRRLR